MSIKQTILSPFTKNIGKNLWKARNLDDKLIYGVILDKLVD